LLVVALLVAACTPGAPANTAAPTAIAAPADSAIEVEPEAVATTEAAAVEAATVEVADAVAADATANVDAPAAGLAMTKLNLNTVTGEELLATIPDFGNRMVREFDEYRPYISIQQFRREIGKYVDEAQVAFYEEYVYVPVQINDSDAATVMQIPGVDAGAAEAIIAARPFDSTDAFLQTLAEVAPAADPVVAQVYLERGE
jgi:DNA uptake protein ComE-like DNA-binding protein